MTYFGLLPDVADPLTAPFWEAARREQLVAQQCVRCGRFRWTPTAVCPECLCSEAQWAELAGTAAVWSYAVYRRAMHPAFAERVPYTVAMLELPERIGMLGMIQTSTGDAEQDGDVRIGDHVRVTFFHTTDEITLVRWIPEG